jgi:molecular chaperone DnaK
VSAKDKGTGKEQSMTIRRLGLSKEEIDRMVKDAEAHADEDKKRREEAEVRNQAESLVYQTEKFVKDSARPKADRRSRGHDQGRRRDRRGRRRSRAPTSGPSSPRWRSWASARPWARRSTAAQAEQAAGGAGDGRAAVDDDVVDAEVVEDDQENK